MALGAAFLAASVSPGAAFMPSGVRLPVASKAASLSAARAGPSAASWSPRLRAANLNMVAAEEKKEGSGIGWNSHVVSLQSLSRVPDQS